MTEIAERWEYRPTAAPASLSVRCCKCHQALTAPEYVCRTWATSAMPAPGFEYYHIACVPTEVAVLLRQRANVAAGATSELAKIIWEAEEIVCAMPRVDEASDPGHVLSVQERDIIIDALAYYSVIQESGL